MSAQVIQRAAAAYSSRDWIEAERLCRRALEALVSYDQAIRLKPDHAQACCNRGNALRDLKRLDEALASYEQAVKLRPDFAEAYGNRGMALQEANRIEEALECLERALELKPEYGFLEGMRLHTKRR